MISILIPVYNGEKYISECVTSACRQTYKDIEVIVVDDGCTDETPKILDELADEYHNLRIIHAPHRGLFSARVTAVKNARGDYICWLDADDFADKSMIQELYNAAVSQNADFVNCDYSFFPQKNKNKEKWFKIYNGNLDWKFIERNMQPWCKLVATSLVKNKEILQEWNRAGDGVYLRIVLKAKKIVTVNKKLYFYRVGHQSMSGGSYDGKVNHYIENLKWTFEQEKFIDGTVYEKNLKQYYQYLPIYAGILLCIVSAYNSDQEEYQRTKKILHQLNFNKNPYTKIVLGQEYGWLKSIILRMIIPNNYWLTKKISKLVLR
ncbi:glycosyltransferase family 2 protein [Limosilactobacillus sp. WILCCON 0053]|uniref:glycosyltransferase family 2 protein n=1 Tax=Limosilactobacillus allomucosae TaxID=3142938 RepID=UPI0032656A03